MIAGRNAILGIVILTTVFLVVRGGSVPSLLVAMYNLTT